VFFYVTRYHWQWALWKSMAVTGLFLSIDIPFLVATSTKFMEGGYLPITVAAFFYLTMVAWTVGREHLQQFYAERAVTMEAFLERMPAQLRERIPGICVIMARPFPGIPSPLSYLVTRLHVLHEHVFLLTVTSESIPVVPPEEQVVLCPLGHGVYTLTVHCGFSDYPDVPRAVELARRKLHLEQIPRAQVQFMTSHESFLRGELGRMNPVLAAWFVFLARNAANVSYYFGLPSDQVTELGTRVEL
jgi:KUP system potassium uptake protein